MEGFTVRCSEESPTCTLMRHMFKKRSAPLDMAVQSVLFGALFCQVRRPAILTAGEKPDADGMVGVRPGEPVRVALVLPRAAAARAYLSKARWLLGASPVIMKLLQRSSDTSITVRRPDGMDVTIEAVSAEGCDNNLRSTWLAGVLFDGELLNDARGIGEINNALRAARSRLLAGAVWGVVSHE